jgi:hypothetical protein
LEDIEHVRAETTDRKRLQMNLYDDDEAINRHFCIRKSAENKYGVLLWRDSEQEVIFDVQGVLAKFMLPPLSQRRFGCES